MKLCNNEFGQPGCSGLSYRHRCEKDVTHVGPCRCVCGAVNGPADKASGMTDMTTDLSLVLSFRNNLRACRACDISTDTNRPVPWSGDSDCEFAIMGEAPGRTEAREGKPFVGDSGAILRHWLKLTGFDSTKMAVLNTVSCNPGRTPNADETKACRGWMNGQLEIIRPKVLITLGVVAYTAIRNGLAWPKLKDVHGKVYRHPTYGFTIMSSYHPASYLRGRNKSYEDKIVGDLKGLRDWYERDRAGESWPSRCYVCDDEFYNYDEYAMPWCLRHSRRQGILFPEDMEIR